MHNLPADLRPKRKRPQGLGRLIDSQGGEAYRHPNNNTSSKPVTRHISLEGAVIATQAAGLIGGLDNIGLHNLQGRDKGILWQSFRRDSIRSQKPAREPLVRSSPKSKLRCKSSTKAAGLALGTLAPMLMVLMTQTSRVPRLRVTLTHHLTVLVDPPLPGVEANPLQTRMRPPRQLSPRQFLPSIHDPIPGHVRLLHLL